MTRKTMIVPVVAIAIALVGAGRWSAIEAQAPAPMNPIGTYTVSTLTEEGMQISGVLTVRADGGDYAGELVSSEAGTVPIQQLTTSANHFMAVFTSNETLAVAWLEKQEDGTLTGSWHQLGPGIGVKMMKTK